MEALLLLPFQSKETICHSASCDDGTPTHNIADCCAVLIFKWNNLKGVVPDMALRLSHCWERVCEVGWSNLITICVVESVCVFVCLFVCLYNSIFSIWPLNSWQSISSLSFLWFTLPTIHPTLTQGTQRNPWQMLVTPPLFLNQADTLIDGTTRESTSAQQLIAVKIPTPCGTETTEYIFYIAIWSWQYVKHICWLHPGPREQACALTLNPQTSSQGWSTLRYCESALV